MKIAIAILFAAAAAYGESANYYLATPEKYEGKNIKLDVRVVRPVHWTSPVEGIRFFHVFTEDKRHNALAGAMLVAVAAGQAEKFVDEYGLRATTASETMRGVLRSALTQKKGGSKLYFVDYEGKCADILVKVGAITLGEEESSPAGRPGDTKGRKRP